MTESDQTSTMWNQKTVQFLERMGKLKLWAGLLAHQAIHHSQQELQKNRDAESAAVRRQLWNVDESNDDMGSQQTILGDVTNPTPVVVTGSSTAFGPLFAALLGAAIPTAGLLGYFFQTLDRGPASPPPPQQQVPQVQVHLGEIEDYLDPAPLNPN